MKSENTRYQKNSRSIPSHPYLDVSENVIILEYADKDGFHVTEYVFPKSDILVIYKRSGNQVSYTFRTPTYIIEEGTYDIEEVNNYFKAASEKMDKLANELYHSYDSKINNDESFENLFGKVFDNSANILDDASSIIDSSASYHRPNNISHSSNGRVNRYKKERKHSTLLPILSGILIIVVISVILYCMVSFGGSIVNTITNFFKNI